MPAQTAHPGVYIEELPSGVHSIAGVSTSVTAFVGAAASGPVETPTRVFSFADYVRTFGPPLDEARPMGHAVQQFFVNGGSQAVVVRAVAADAVAAFATLRDATPADVLTLTARGKGDWANRTAGAGLEASVDYASTANPDDLFDLLVTQWSVDPRTNASVKAAEESHTNLSMSPASPRYALNVLAGSTLVEPALADVLAPGPAGSSTGASALGAPQTIPAGARSLRLAVDFASPVDITLFGGEAGELSKSRNAIVDELNARIADAGVAATVAHAGGILQITSAATDLNSSVVVTPGSSGDITQTLALGLAWGGTEISASAPRRPVASPPGDAAGRFAGGTDGSGVGPGDIVPPSTRGGVYALGVLLFPRFNLLCLPGVTSDDVVQIGAAIAYCRDERAFLVVDSPAGGFAAIPPNLGSLPALGEHAALYYPRLKLVESQAGGTTRTLNLPPCGAVAGVIARIDTRRGIWKAPAGIEAGIAGVNDLTQPTDDNLSGQLNPKGVNVLRTFPGAGMVIWGARTLKGDDSQSSEWKYVPVRRLANYIESSLSLGTQFAVFEPNDPDLWGQLRLAVGSFMRGLFRQGAFQQSTRRNEADSFFVVCDETVNPQSEIDLGRVNIVVGFAPLKPAEFVVISITQLSQLEA